MARGQQKKEIASRREEERWTDKRIGKVETKGFENVFLVEIPLEKRVEGMTYQKDVLFLGIWDDDCNRFALIKQLQ